MSDNPTIGYTRDEAKMAEAIYAALNDNRSGYGGIVFTYNDFFREHGTIGVDGDVHLLELSRLIIKHMTVGPE